MTGHIRCDHGYSHHAGPHACDPYNHDGLCLSRDAFSYASKLLGIQSFPPRETRMDHTHVFQRDNGVAGCPACEDIDVWHMTTQYFEKANLARMQEEYERRLRE
jgi:hypothetical protein